MYVVQHPQTRFMYSAWKSCYNRAFWPSPSRPQVDKDVGNVNMMTTNL